MSEKRVRMVDILVFVEVMEALWEFTWLGGCE